MSGIRALQIAILACVYCFPVVTSGDDVPETPPAKLTIYPAAAARPALKYLLLPEFKNRVDGNAAVYYGKVTAENSGIFNNRELIEQIDAWRELPLAELRKPDVSMPTERIENMLARAARCESCDWQLPVREPNYFEMPLPEAQQTRQFARILAARARIQIAHGEYDEALATFQSSFALARNVAAGETIVNALIGVAIGGITFEQLTEFVQQPDAPNLYWALASLPRPLIDIRAAMEAEANGFASTFPEFADFNAHRSPDEWLKILDRFWRKLVEIAGDKEIQELGADALMSQSIQEYPLAKKALVDRGYEADKVDAMPAAQVIIAHTMLSFNEMRDDIFKWFFVTYPESIHGLQAASEQFSEDVAPTSTPGRLARMLLPAVKAIRTAVSRADREIAILRVVEALRIYGASHNGQLPPALSDVAEVPVPADPMTGKPFEYRLQDGTAILNVTPLPGRPAVYEIKMARP